MIIKAIISAPTFSKKSHKQQIFEVFGKSMVIESITKVEDTVKILVTEIVSLFLEDFFDIEEQL